MNKCEFRNNLVQVLHEKYENIRDVQFAITMDMEEGIVELKTSLRFRRPSVIKFRETGHPPFTVIE